MKKYYIFIIFYLFFITYIIKDMVKQNGRGFIASAIKDVKDNQNVFEPAYDTISNIGLIYKFIGAVITSCIAIVAIIIGFILIRLHSKKTQKTTGIIKIISCSSDTPRSKNNSENLKSQKECEVNIEYTVGEETFSKNYTFQKVVNDNDRVTIYYDPSYPDSFVVENYNFFIGITIIVIGIISMISAWALFAMTYF